MPNGRIAWLRPEDPPDHFPDEESALREPNGLLAVGGDLSENRLVEAYRRGIFPWYDSGQPILWWSPDPRCVLEPAQLRISRRLRQYIRQSSLRIEFNRNFNEVILACAGRRRPGQQTWLLPEMIAAYEKLHTSGWAHSVEIWDFDRLVGGLYGLCIGRVFFGESMFSRKDNASKFAMLGLAGQMLLNDIDLLDCQVVSGHLLRLGATQIPRAEFCRRLDKQCDPPLRFRRWPAHPMSAAESLAIWERAALQ